MGDMVCLCGKAYADPINVYTTEKDPAFICMEKCMAGDRPSYEEVQAHSALAKKIHESMLNARKTVGDYIQLNDVAYTNKRNAALG